MSLKEVEQERKRQRDALYDLMVLEALKSAGMRVGGRRTA